MSKYLTIQNIPRMKRFFIQQLPIIQLMIHTNYVQCMPIRKTTKNYAYPMLPGSQLTISIQQTGIGFSTLF
jgi:hypothetical protein